MTNINRYRAILAALLVLLLAACGSEHARKPLIAVSVEPQRYLLEQLTGDNFEVVTLLKPGSNPETFEPTMNTRKELDRSAAYFYVGSLPFERVLLSATGSLPRYNTSEGIEPLYGTHSHDHDHGDGSHHGEEPDPHVWTSVRNARVMAANMAAALAEIDPANANLYSRRLDVLDSRLDSIDNALARRLADAPTRSFMVWHPSLGYFARDYGLEQLSVGWESKEPSAAVLRHAIDEVREHGVKVFFFQREFDTRQTNSLTRQLGLRTVSIDQLNYDWLDQMNLITDELVRP